jgi:hypothetical protein
MWMPGFTKENIRRAMKDYNNSFDKALALDLPNKDALYRKGISRLALGNSTQVVQLFKEA